MFFLGAIVLYLVVFVVYVDVSLCIFLDLLDIKLIVNKRGSPEAPPTHWSISFILKNKENILKRKIMQMHSEFFYTVLRRWGYAPP